MVSSGFFSSSTIIGFYMGICLTVGAAFRSSMLLPPNNTFIQDARDPGKLLNLVACIYRQRLEKNLKREEELFFLLQEVLRSPELLKHLTGSSLKVEYEEAQESPEAMRSPVKAAGRINRKKREL